MPTREASSRTGAAPRVRGHESRNALVAAALLAFVGAALVALYTGVEVMLVRARPLWHTPLLPLQFFVTAWRRHRLALLSTASCPDTRRAGDPAHGLGVGGDAFGALVVGAVWLALGLSGLSPTHAEALAQVAPSANWQFQRLAVAATGHARHRMETTRSGLLIGLLALHSAG